MDVSKNDTANSPITKYSARDKFAAMELLKFNGVSYRATEKMLKSQGLSVCRKTLTRWHKDPEVGGQIFTENHITAIQQIPMESPEKIFNFATKASEALGLAIDCAMDRIRENKVSDKDLESYLKIFHSIATPNSTTPQSESSTGILSLILSMQEENANSKDVKV